MARPGRASSGIRLGAREESNQSHGWSLSRGFALTPLEPLPISLGDDGRGGGDEAREASEGRDGCFTRLLRTASDGSAA